MSFRIHVDPTNPGQFFACCGLFELASRLDPEALAHFEHTWFVVSGSIDLPDLLHQWATVGFRQLDSADDAASPLRIDEPFGLHLDWWKDKDSGGRELKVWAGSMQNVRIAQAMLAALRNPALHHEAILDAGQIVYEPAEPAKKVEPFYFDARRAANAHARDIGFAPNDLDLRTIAFPAVEALCLVGLQRCRPLPARRRVFSYRSWPIPLPIALVSAVVAGAAPLQNTQAYQFEAGFRTGQRKHKAFRAAIPISRGE
jgi:CRISPR-associated protein Csb3